MAVRQSKVAKELHPVLQRGNSSFPYGAYEHEYDANSGLVTVTHKLREANLVSRMLDDDFARFACRVNINAAGYHRFFWSGDEIQQLELNESFKHETKEFQPLVVATGDMQCTLKASDGVSSEWVGTVVKISKGAKVALGEPYTLSPYSQLDEAELTNLHTSLLREKGSDLQRKFLQLAKNSKAFTKWIRSKIAVTDGQAVPLLSSRISERDFADPSPAIEQKLYDTWRDVSPAIARRQSFWGEVSLRNIESDKLESSYLAVYRHRQGGEPTSGRDRINLALSSGEAKRIDDCVRDVLRRFSGLQAARGQISVYVNCHFARAWWRSYLLREICDRTVVDRESMSDLFHVGQDFWEGIVRWLIKNNAVIGDTAVLGDPAVLRTSSDRKIELIGDTTATLGDMVSSYTNVRNVFVKSLVYRYQANPGSVLFTSASLRRLSEKLGSYSEIFEFGLLTERQLEGIIGPAMDELA